MRILSIAFLALACAACPKKNDDPSATDSSTTSAVAKGLSLLAGGAFAGEVDMKFTNASGTGNGSIFVKGTKQRMEFQLPDKGNKTSSVIMDSADKKMIMLDETTKTAMVMSLDDMGKPSGVPGVGGGAGAPPKEHNFTKTGRKDVVAGYECEIWTYEEPDSKGELCAADGMSLLGMKMFSMSALTGTITGAPLRAITQTKDGKEKERWEVTKIERKAIGDDKFQVPPGYKTVDMNDMLKGLGNLPGVRRQ